ncbi:hypothetical protein OG322_40575 [Streptomyces sp. NBC_01260]|nr:MULTISPECIES: hypothetical protein [unclassified Streptomyces]MCX4774978.1 hypothetical protein [Streptomyces sp. NBC_01285]RPK36926.1 hypothetical protein EES39_31270 [Streptomyces sp. ADI92-24]
MDLEDPSLPPHATRGDYQLGVPLRLVDPDQPKLVLGEIDHADATVSLAR